MRNPRLPALTLVACDLGASCGPDSQRLAMQCAMQGYCAANNLYDYTYFYESAPYQAQLMEQYRDTPMDLADASLVATAEVLNLRRIFTLDSDFYVYRINNTGAFEVAP